MRRNCLALLPKRTNPESTLRLRVRIFDGERRRLKRSIHTVQAVHQGALMRKTAFFILGNIPDPLTISEKLAVSRRYHEIVFLLIHSAISRFIAALITGFVNSFL